MHVVTLSISWTLKPTARHFSPYISSALSLSPCLLSSCHHTHFISLSWWILETLLSLHEKSEHQDAFNIKALVLTNLHWTFPMSAVFFSPSNLHRKLMMPGNVQGFLLSKGERSMCGLWACFFAECGGQWNWGCSCASCQEELCCMWKGCQSKHLHLQLSLSWALQGEYLSFSLSLWSCLYCTLSSSFSTSSQVLR